MTRRTGFITSFRGVIPVLLNSIPSETFHGALYGLACGADGPLIKPRLLEHATPAILQQEPETHRFEIQGRLSHYYSQDVRSAIPRLSPRTTRHIFVGVVETSSRITN